MSEKVQKLLAKAGLGSRREMEAMIEAGRVSVNGEKVTLGARATANDKIRYDGRLIHIPKEESFARRVLVYHKNVGEVCTRKDPEGRATVFDNLPSAGKGRWIAVGRLDLNTSGLLLFTNDGELANRLMHPSYEFEREYAVRVRGEVSKESLEQLRQGVQLDDGSARFERVTFSGGEGSNQWYHATLKEGKNREVRRLWEAVGCVVSRLIRIRYGMITLSSRIKRGRWLELEADDLKKLEKLVDLKPSPKVGLSQRGTDYHRQKRQRLQAKRPKRLSPRRKN